MSVITEVRNGVGTSVRRPDGIPKVKGEFAYSSDMWAEDMLWGATLRSPHPRARIRSIEIGAALAALHAHDHALPILALTAVVPVAQGGIDAGARRAGPSRQRFRGRDRCQEGNDQRYPGDQRRQMTRQAFLHGRHAQQFGCQTDERP